MKRFFEILIAIQIIGGAIYFCALMSAPIATTQKVLAAILLMFVSAGIFLAIVAYLALAKAYRLLIEQICKGVEADRFLVGSLDTPELLDYIQHELTGGIWIGRASNVGYILLGMYVFWVFAGWVLSRFVV